MSNTISTRGGHRPASYVLSSYAFSNVEGSSAREIEKIDRSVRETAMRVDKAQPVICKKGSPRLGAIYMTRSEKLKRKKKTCKK